MYSACQEKPNALLVGVENKWVISKTGLGDYFSTIPKTTSLIKV